MSPSETVTGGQTAARLAEVQRRVTDAARAAGRPPESVTLVAVSKTFDPEHIRPAILAGQRHFGENRVQEALSKWPALKAEFPDVVLHLIGPLQTNKAREAVGLFDVIETVDRERLAAALQKEFRKTKRRPGLMIEVNTGEEPQKAGISPSELTEFRHRMETEYGLKPRGLMCIPPIDEEPALHFALLQKLGQEAGLGELSMGMSADFETAIRFGATHVRVGTAIFGPRA